jgi:hypothetical protein
MWQIEAPPAASSGYPSSRQRPHVEVPKNREISRKMGLENSENSM